MEPGNQDMLNSTAKLLPEQEDGKAPGNINMSQPQIELRNDTHKGECHRAEHDFSQIQGAGDDSLETKHAKGGSGEHCCTS